MYTVCWCRQHIWNKFFAGNRNPEEKQNSYSTTTKINVARAWGVENVPASRSVYLCSFVSKEELGGNSAQPASKQSNKQKPRFRWWNSIFCHMSDTEKNVMYILVWQEWLNVFEFVVTGYWCTAKRYTIGFTSMPSYFLNCQMSMGITSKPQRIPISSSFLQLTFLRQVTRFSFSIFCFHRQCSYNSKVWNYVV